MTTVKRHPDGDQPESKFCLLSLVRCKWLPYPLSVSMVTNTSITANFTSNIPEIVVQENNAENLDGSVTVLTWNGVDGLGGADTFSFANPVYTN